MISSNMAACSILPIIRVLLQGEALLGRSLIVSCCLVFLFGDIWIRIESVKRRPMDFLLPLSLGLAFSSPGVDLLGENFDLTEPSQEANRFLVGVLGYAGSILRAVLCLGY